MYWPGDNKDNYNPISFTHPFEIKEPSNNAQGTSNYGKSGGVKAQEMVRLAFPDLVY